jgi:hypothetical protein
MHQAGERERRRELLQQQARIERHLLRPGEARKRPDEIRCLDWRIGMQESAPVAFLSKLRFALCVFCWWLLFWCCRCVSRMHCALSRVNAAALRGQSDKAERCRFRMQA